MLGPVRDTYSQRRSTAEPTGVIIGVCCCFDFKEVDSPASHFGCVPVFI